MGHAVATGLAGLVIYVTGSFNMVMVLSVAFSGVGVLVIAMLDDTSHVLIPDWEDDVLLAESAQNLQMKRAPGAAGADD